MRSAWLPVGLVLLGAAGAPLACGEAFQGAGGTTSGTGGGATTGMGGAGGGSTSSTDSASASTSSSSSTGAGTCTTATDCSGVTTLCGQVTCTNGACGLQPLQPDGTLFSQVYGDCHVLMCKGGQLVTKVNNDDLYDDGNECTIDVCENGTPVTQLDKGSSCSSTNKCSAAGACVECLEDGDCTDLAPMCQSNRCVPVTCTNATKDVGEIGVDCSGPCAPCADGTLCGKTADCASGFCSIKAGESMKTCHHSCTDGTKNGTETGVDCGGMVCSARCGSGVGCLVPGDCETGVCKGGLCQTPTCTDGVKNSAETGIDCGTGCPQACPG